MAGMYQDLDSKLDELNQIGAINQSSPKLTPRLQSISLPIVYSVRPIVRFSAISIQKVQNILDNN